VIMGATDRFGMAGSDRSTHWTFKRNQGHCLGRVATWSLATGRDLTAANLSGADVRHLDFSQAILHRATLDGA
jgi:uncharacterized protein YjbI with pentapeptide repeats